MTSLLDIVTDLVNDAKSCNDSQSKLYILEQIREIVIHRDKLLLKNIVPSLFDLVVDKSIAVRVFLVKFGSTAMQHDGSFVLPFFLNMIHYLISDSNDKVLALILKEFRLNYSIFVLGICNVPASTKLKTLSDPRHLWSIFQAVRKKLNELIIHSSSEAVKSCTLQLYLTEILFGIPAAVAQTVDPRLKTKKVDPRLVKATTEIDSNGAEMIPLHHFCVSRNEIIQDAEDLFTKLLLWAANEKIGPQSSPFSAHLVVELGLVISDIACARPSHQTIAKSSHALLLLMQGKGGIFSSLSPSDSQGLIRAVHRLQRAAVSVSAQTGELEKTLLRLKEAVAVLSSIGSNEKVGEKRGWSSAEEDDSDSEARRQSARSAVDFATTALLQTTSSVVKAASSRQDSSASQVPVVCNESSSVQQRVAWGEVTVLSTGLFVDSPATPLIASEVVSAVPPLRPSGPAGDLKPSLKLVALSDEDCGTLSLSSLERLLRSYPLLAIAPTLDSREALLVFQVMCVRSVLAMAVKEMAGTLHHEHGYPVGCKIALVASVGVSHISSSIFPAKVPECVLLPRSVWIFLSFCMDNATGDLTHSVTLAPQQQSLDSRVSLLLRFLCALHSPTRVGCSDDDRASLYAVYEKSCLVCLSRFVQASHLRSSVVRFLFGLPSIPTQCLHLLQLVSLTGSKTSSGKGVVHSSHADPTRRLVGTRQESLELLVQVVMASNGGAAGLEALCFLLWCCASDDFEVRNKVVATVVSDVFHVADWANELVVQFSLHSVIAVVGADKVRKWAMQSSSATSESAPLASVLATFDDGVCFRGSFSGTFSSVGSAGLHRLPAETDTKRALHLLTQLCLVDNHMIGALVDLFCASAGEDSPNAEDGESRSDGSIMRSSIAAALHNIIPSLLVTCTPDLIFTSVSQAALRDGHVSVRPLVQEVLGLLLHDLSAPPSPALLDAVLTHLAAATGLVKPVLVLVEESESVNKTVQQPLFGFWNSLSDDEDFRLVAYLVGGLNEQNIVAVLPRVVRHLAADTDALKAVVVRITKSRPPAMSKTSLLVALHRIECEGPVEVKPKAVLDALSVCLNNRADFSGEVVKEALRILMGDDVPVFALMRTAILAGQSFVEVKKFVLAELVPCLVTKRVWVVAPKVWDGVNFAVKNFAAAGAQSFEIALKALLSVPGTQLRAVVKAAPNVVAPMAKLLSSLSSEERDFVLRGVGKDAVDAEKLRLVKELLSSKVN